MSVELTERLIAGAAGLLATRGLVALNADVLARQERCGKAAIYRRWPNMTYLVSTVIISTTLIPDPTSTGALSRDLASLFPVRPGPPEQAELAVAAAASWAVTNEVVHRAVEHTLSAPIERGVAAVAAAARARGQAVHPGRVWVWRSLIEALWWQRLGPEPRAWEPDELAALFEGVVHRSTGVSRVT